MAISTDEVNLIIICYMFMQPQFKKILSMLINSYGMNIKQILQSQMFSKLTFRGKIYGGMPCSIFIRSFQLPPLANCEMIIIVNI